MVHQSASRRAVPTSQQYPTPLLTATAHSREPAASQVSDLSSPLEGKRDGKRKKNSAD